MKLALLDRAYEVIGELRNHYYELAKKLHPDMGGTDEEMKVLNAEYEFLYDRVISGTYEKWSEWSTEFKAKFWENDIALRAIIDEILHLPKIDIEVCGAWIWVGGDTKPVKDELKKAGMKYSSNKEKWYWSPDGYRKHNKKVWNMGEVREMFGSQKVEKEERETLNK